MFHHLVVFKGTLFRRLINDGYRLFLSKNSDWLDSEYCVPLPNSEKIITESTPSTSFEKRGRPCVSYGDLSESSKKRKNTMLLKDFISKYTEKAALDHIT